MQIGLILAALQRHRLAALVIALEIALACAVLCNACFLIAERMQAMRIDTGVDESALAVIRLDGYDESRATDLNARMLAGLAALPGVQSASAINAVPFGPRAGTAGIKLDPEGKHFGGVVDFYVGGPGSLEALGVQVVAGRAPQAGDYQPMAGFLPSDASVLVIDDDPVQRDLMQRFLAHVARHGAEVWVCRRADIARRLDPLAVDAHLLEAMTPQEMVAETTSVYDNYVEVLETGSVEALQHYARDLSERIIPRGVETHEVVGIVLLLRDVLARSLFEKYQRDFGLLNRVLDAYEPAANRIANTVAVSFVEQREPTAVRLVQVLFREYVLRRPARDDAHVEEHHVVEVFRHRLEVVVDDECWPLPKYREMLFPV